MSYNLSEKQTFHTQAVLAPRLRVKLVGNLIVDLAQAGDEGIGFADQGNYSWVDALGNTNYTDTDVIMASASGTFEAIANGAIAQNAEYYGAASGKISATPAGRPLGRVLEAATADGDVVRVTLYALPKFSLPKALSASSVSEYLYVADGACKVSGIQTDPAVAGSDAGAVTVAVRKILAGSGALPGDAAGANVVELLTAAINLKSAAGTPVAGTLSAVAGALTLAKGDAIAFKLAGTQTAVVALLQVEVVRQ